MPIKTIHYLLIVLTAGVLALVGCGKEKANVGESTPSARFAQFMAAFQNPTPEQQQSVAKVSTSVRYRMYSEAIPALEQLSGDASLTDAQKTTVSNLIVGLKQLTANAPPPPAQK